MPHVWFLSSAGERHEDHIPAGIFSSLEKVEEALRKEDGNLVIEREDESVVHFTSYYEAADSEGVNFVYTARRVQVDEYDPAILNT